MSQFDITPKNSNYFYRNNPVRNRQLFNNEGVMPFWIADMDFEIAEPIRAELQKLVDRGVFAYENVPPDFYQVMANWFNTKHDFSLKSQYFLAVPGILTGISFLIEELTQKGDAILIQTPVYHQFISAIKNTERTLVCNSLRNIDNYYSIDFEVLEEQIVTQQVKMMIFCNPHNPVGRVWTKDEIAQVVAICQKHSVYLVSDEVHSEIIFAPNRFTSLGTFEGEKHISILGSSGKTFGLQSIASGFFYISDNDLRPKLQKRIEALYLNHSNVFTKMATYAAYQKGGEWLTEMLQYVEQNYRWIQEFLQKELPQIKILPLEGTYLIWLDFRGLNLPKEELEELLFQKAAVGFAPGDWFGEDGLGYMRMTISVPREQLERAFDQLKKAFVEAGVS